MIHKKGFKLRQVCGENIIVAEGRENIDFSKIISMNETAAFLWEKTDNMEFDKSTLVSLLMSEYEVTEDIAISDIDKLITKWTETGIIE